MYNDAYYIGWGLSWLINTGYFSCPNHSDISDSNAPSSWLAELKKRHPDSQERKRYESTLIRKEKI
jgi:hypothetical protein